jgi:ubiquitin C-terminal hydrolase
MGQVIYVEYSNNSNQWPTENTAVSGLGKGKHNTSSTTLGSEEIQKTNGLYNLGNTCYMNSALQCLANTKFFNDYFIKDKKYLTQMNLKNKSGHSGDLAQNFA